MAGEEELRELLPKLRFNREFKKRQAYRYKKRVEAREKEMELISGKKRPASSKGDQVGKRSTEKPVAAKKKGAAEPKKGKTAKKARTPKLKVANAETGKETLKKKKARELVATIEKKKKSTAASKVSKKQPQQELKTTEKKMKATRSGAAVSSAAAATPSPPLPLTPTERDRALLARAIRGDDLAGGEGASADAGDGAAFIRQDPSLYPDLEFLDEYAEKKHAEVVSADQLLENAHHFFKDLGKREQALNRVAKEHINHLRAVNRRGGDKDGFRYVVPKNVKSVVRELLAAQKARDGVEDAEALIDPQSLVSTFGGDGVAETSDKPVRRSRRKRNRTYSDFYQFQVSKKWTRNAENFLRRSRPNKMLFEAKKHQRSIKNF
ncbi:Ribosomal RNA-processing protein 7 (RRP7) C-terminal domain containing protein [Lotmaria passim]